MRPAVQGTVGLHSVPRPVALLQMEKDAEATDTDLHWLKVSADLQMDPPSTFGSQAM
jgi:hypothetical protein